jgi:hypothetical protein
MFNPGDTFPYIGLRPFSEEDSLYFKGRDEQILQLAALLETNKFLMVTGASGDGKSSLVYAGLVPNARAGFFRAQYTNWVVADFRPERTPLHNLSKTISKALGMDDDSVNVELNRGFSSLIELYLNSSLFLDEQSEAWKNGTADERESMQRGAANLLIVADQFEEFFTNPENYYKNSPSADSQLVINLLLETARISIAKKLPVYVVCTMRSDYIGQCAAFRGLSEFIGFSQFFVPRLKRKEMIQVVKDPAALHGDRISNRLAERVVYDLGEGIDQLPVLEHAMNEVWIQAKNGSEELDLIHYAMAGGMPASELPADDKTTFLTWFSTLPPKLQEAYQRPGLSHIIDTHANKLYLSAADHYNENHDTKISNADAQLIIKVAFICLTKMDEDRAVRNRMTLQEITDILARPELTYQVVGGVLNIFREPGNTFLRPYISDDPDTKTLRPETVLDITHESLIRNWELLLSWAKEEYDHLTVYEDFKKQLDRWIESNKAKGFLLPIGPLTFFEDWHDRLKPNEYWVNRYLDPSVDKETRMAEARRIIDDTHSFLRRSAQRVRITRLVVKYGASRIAGVIGTILILCLCGFYYWDAQRKVNENVVKKVLEEGKKYVADPRFEITIRAEFLIMSECLRPGSYTRMMDQVPSDQQFDLIRSTYLNFMVLGVNPALRASCLIYGDSLIGAVPIKKNDPAFLVERIKALNILVMAANHYLYAHNDSQVKQARQHALAQTKEILLQVFNQNIELNRLKIAALDDGIENVLNNNTLSDEEIGRLLSIMSPFESPESKKIFNRYFPVDKVVQYSRSEHVKHNAGYQELAYLYASLGRVNTVKSCVDSLLKYHLDYSTFRNNILNIATYLFKKGYVKETDDLLAYYAQKQKISKKELYELWLNCSGYMDRHMAWKMFGENHNSNLELMDFATVNKLFDQYYRVIQKEYSNPDELNFNMALYCKHRGVILSKIDADKGGMFHVNPDSLFAKAIAFYQKLPNAYLQGETEVYAESIFVPMAKQMRKRKELFLYPDHLQKVRNNRTVPPRYYTDKFFSYLLKNHLFAFYTEPKDFSLIHDWIFSANRFNHPNYFSRVNRNFTPLHDGILRSVDSIYTHNPLAKDLNGNLERMLLMEEYVRRGQSENVEPLIQKIDIEKIKENLREGDPSDQEIFSYRMHRLIVYFVKNGRREEAIKIIRSHLNNVNIIKGYATAPMDLLNDVNGPKQDAYVYLDSALTAFDRITDFIFLTEDPRISFVMPLSQIGGKQMTELALKYVAKMPISQQSGAVENLILGIALRDEFYEAYTAIPEIALVDKLHYFNIILSEEAARKTQDSKWKEYLWNLHQQWKWSDINYEPEVF